MGQVPDEIAATVRTFLGDTMEASYVSSPRHRECETCRGLGKVRTGSHVPQFDTLTCETCKGSGFYPPPGGTVSVTADPSAEQTAVNGDHFTAPDAEADPWGSPRLLADGMPNPNYGRMPQFKDASLP